MSRGLRNNNPGNIRLSKVRYKGECKTSTDTSFRQFISMEWGYRAMFMLLHTYQRRYGLNTIRGIINRYAPEIENDTQNYIRTVSRMTGISTHTPIDTLCSEEMIPIVVIMSFVENGKKAVLDDVKAGWDLFRAK